MENELTLPYIDPINIFTKPFKKGQKYKTHFGPIPKNYKSFYKITIITINIKLK